MEIEKSKKDYGIVDYLLTTNEFKRPIVLQNATAVGSILLKLLLMDPGTNPLYPKMGVGLGHKYRFISSEDINIIRQDIENQMNAYLPPEIASTASVILKIGDRKFLKVIIVIDGQSYSYDTENSSTPVEFSD